MEGAGVVTAYETFVRDVRRTLSGRPVVLTLRDLSPGRKKYRGFNVRAIVSHPPRPGEPSLTLRSVVGVKQPQPCSVRILEELPDTFAAEPYSDLFEAMERLERDE
jgi:hypothetical protein